MSNLNKIKIGVSGLDGSIYIYRHGKDPALALDKRPAEPDVLAAFIEHMLYDMPKGAQRVVTFGDQKYKLSCKPITQATGEAGGSE